MCIYAHTHDWATYKTICVEKEYVEVKLVFSFFLTVLQINIVLVFIANFLILQTQLSQLQLNLTVIAYLTPQTLVCAL